MLLNNYKIRILRLAERWQLDSLSRFERLELETWFWAVEDESLGTPTELSIDKLERHLHQLFIGQSERQDLGDGPPHPFK